MHGRLLAGGCPDSRLQVSVVPESADWPGALTIGFPLQSRMTALSRRRFLGIALGGAAGAAAGALTTITAAPALGSEPRGLIVASSLTDTLTLLTGAGANVLAAKGPEGLLLVDGGLAKHSAQLLKAAYKHTGSRQVHTLMNTHWHPEQTGSNER